MKKIYLMPGFALDSDIFSRLDIPGVELIPMNWLDPKVEESLEEYAQRIIKKYKIKAGKSTILIGHSFGGMLVQTIASIIEVGKIILISSVKSIEEKPLTFKMIPMLPIEKWFNKALITHSVNLWGPLNGYDTKEKQEIFKNMVNNKSEYYFHWSLKQILEWERPHFTAPIYHIHGDQDRTFLLSRIKNPIIIKGGHHLMVIQKSKEISAIIQDILMGKQFRPESEKLERIDMEKWNRKEHFSFFRDFEDPYFSTVAKVDCQDAWIYAKQGNFSFFAIYLYCAIQAANQIEPFRYRIAGDEVLIHPSIHASSTIGRKDGTFAFSFIPYHNDFEIFQQGLNEEIEIVQQSQGIRANAGAGRTDLIYFTAVPWITFTGLKHARNRTSSDSIPRIAFGKNFEEKGRMKIPVSVEVNHALMDGKEVGLFYEKLEQILKAFPLKYAPILDKTKN